MLLQHFWLGLNKESELDIAAGGSFTHKTIEEGEALLDRILENTPHLEPLHVEPMLSPEEVSSAEAEPTPSIQRTSPELEDPEEGFQPSDLPYFEDDFFEDFRNTSNYLCQKRPPVPITPVDPLDESFLRESVKEVIAIMKSEWVEEAELFLKKFRFTPLLQPFNANSTELRWMFYTILWSEQILCPHHLHTPILVMTSLLR
jgi:hypothetical protein